MIRCSRIWMLVSSKFLVFVVPIVIVVVGLLVPVIGSGSLELRSISYGSSVYEYNVCNGLSNQLLYHAASIAIAITERYDYVAVPDCYIVDGVQTTNTDVLPNRNNSVSFDYVFDSSFFQNSIEALSTTRLRFVTIDDIRVTKCAGMQAVLKADPLIMKKVLDAFQPSMKISNVIHEIHDQLSVHDKEHAVCVHHRDGEDWHEHCSRWGSIPDGIYRGNCLGLNGMSFIDTLFSRGVTERSWIYYCGDHEPPAELTDIVSVYTQAMLHTSINNDYNNSYDREVSDWKFYQNRDVAALVDFFVCRDIDVFIGNSVSTFSALQIAIRKMNNTYWYNSQSIPLSELWKAYEMPIVYTYTELSKQSGKYLLKTSISSVRRHMPYNQIHVLYHGSSDLAFLAYLKDMNVTIHPHNPDWRDKIEQMRLNGNAMSSNLFLHSGNYFGTWQRIDIPLFIPSEYCLLLDADTVVKRPFTIADFGLNLTFGIAMSAEMDMDDKRPWNAGVTVMNLPYLRTTHTAFLDYIFAHINTSKFDHPAPSDQGAYLAFYGNVSMFLPISFNFKPYWHTSEKVFDNSYIIHYHGPKPHEYISKTMGKKCDAAIDFLCEVQHGMEFLCRTLQHFGAAANIEEYCLASFPDSIESRSFCSTFLELIVNDDNGCAYHGLLLHGSNAGLPSSVLAQTAFNMTVLLRSSHISLSNSFSAQRDADNARDLDDTIRTLYCVGEVIMIMCLVCLTATLRTFTEHNKRNNNRRNMAKRKPHYT